ncbi:hypothetical protein ANCCEY_03319 [Ancylostoma ceylanicum]|uniref:Peptidase M13 N-terminal domain-containing protein n=1 Tax=Ancylostoma ceylanicum TaxID=53326 RepID=A0A0D6M574_9BILA|nr:hypothetical protein ANCCEY_03319 [Ancylostoma ceylanicum]
MSWSYGDHFDITDLLVYFNQNRTIMKELVPWISADFMNNSIARLAIQSEADSSARVPEVGQHPFRFDDGCRYKNDVVSKAKIGEILIVLSPSSVAGIWEVARNRGTNVKRRGRLHNGDASHESNANATRTNSSPINQFLKEYWELDKALLICKEVGYNCSKSKVSKEVGKMYLFVQKIAANTLDGFPADEEEYNSDFLHRLSEVDALMSSVNWTKYLLKTVPAIHHSYIINDPIVIAEKAQQETINSILLSTRKEVIVNYAMLLYILSWIEYMDDKYRTIVEARVGHVSL